MDKECLCCFKAIADKSRAEIYNLVQKTGVSSVSFIVSKFNLTQPTVSYHLIELAKCGLLLRTKKGREVYYHVPDHCNKEKEKKCPVC